MLDECGVFYETFDGTPAGKDDLVKKIELMLKYKSVL